MKSDLVLLGHGSGGRLGHQLLDDLIIPALSGTARQDQDDAAVLAATGARLAYTTDSYVIDPIFFPGGNIGDLAIHGTVNDLAMAGASPRFLSVGLILEEGLPIADLRQILHSMRAAADRCGVKVVTGDTKVVPHGKADRLFINTSGLGVIEHPHALGGSRARVGDKILVNGTLGDHGMAVLASREGLELSTPIVSDSAPLHELTASLLDAVGPALHCLRDPTRGGAATTLKEIARQAGVEITLEETMLPITPAVRGACDLLGLDPLFVANEGKLLAFVAPDSAETALRAMQIHSRGGQAAIIGEVTGTRPGKVRLRTAIGGLRAIEMLSGEQLPRIC